jgi:peptidyl-tRNA hydrolase
MNKQVIIVRRDLLMPPGKVAAQAAHASMKAVLDHAMFSENTITIDLTDQNIGPWLRNDFTKVVLGIDSALELEKLVANAKEAGLPAAIIIDNGRTVFNGVHTMTCGAIGPAPIAEVDKFTKHLKLF